MIANIFAPFFTTESDPRHARWCEWILQKVICLLIDHAHCKRTDKRTDGQEISIAER